jgi:Fic family protein
MPGGRDELSGYQWKEIPDLPEDVESLRDRELELLFQAWAEERNRLDPHSVETFGAQLAREWAIETGIIEGVYTLDRGITRTLIKRGIESAYISHDATDRDPELVARMIQAHADVLEGLFAFVKGERELGTGYIKELHAALLRHQETVTVFDQLGRAFETTLEKGAYKALPNNPTRPDGSLYEYCPPEHVASEMDRLIQMHREHERRAILPHVEAAWLHHAFTQIHPFQDGNGRVARALASIVFIKHGYFPLVVTRDDRERYIAALEEADARQLSDLVRVFAQLQKRALTKAIGMAVETRPVRSVEEAIAATRDLLRHLGGTAPGSLIKATEIADRLAGVTRAKFDELRVALSTDLSRINQQLASGTDTFISPAEALRTVATALQYDPNTNDYLRPVVATFTSNGRASQIVILFHGVSAAFRGLLATAGYFQARGGSPIPVCEDIFRISYQEPPDQAEKRYIPWLDACIIRGLAEWRRTLV